jgi:phenylpyruvate tautomerase PptA (4-oxalocrotonate tautomerase family)
MPFVRTVLPIGIDPTRRHGIVQGIHEALVESIGMPHDELFNLVTEYRDGEFFFDRSFNGISRSDHLIVVEITMRRGRSDAMKRALYAAIARNLETSAEVSSKDIFILMHENDYSDWSVGNGVFAMAIAQQRGTDG